MRSPCSITWIYLIERGSFGQKYKFSNKNDMVSAWRNFKNIFSRPLFTIIFRTGILKFHPYSILTVDTMVEFVIFCVLSKVQEFFTYYSDYPNGPKFYEFCSRSISVLFISDSTWCFAIRKLATEMRHCTRSELAWKAWNFSAKMHS